VEKTYVAKLMSVPRPSELNVLRRGLPIEGKMTNPAQVNFLEKKGGKAWVSLTIAEGRYHQVRKMFDAIGHRVTKLRRAAIGPLELIGLEPGEWRYLTGKEVREVNDYMDRRSAEVAEKGPPPDVPRHEKRIETPADRAKRRIVRQAIAQAARKKEVDKEKAAKDAKDAKDAERKGPRQPKPSWKRGAKAPGQRSFPRTKGKSGRR
jgi:hypothetical protein